MNFYLLLLFVSMTYADTVFRVQSLAGLCKLNYKEAHARCKLLGAHLATESEIEELDTSSCAACGWTLEQTRVCSVTAVDASCGPRCEKRSGGRYDAWCYAGGLVGNCSSALGIELRNNNNIHLRATSEKNDWWRLIGTKWSAGIARLHNKDNVNAWMPEQHRTDSESEYLEVGFNDLTAVTGLVTQGASRLNTKMWVTKYKVKYSLDGDNFKFITEGGETKIFDGNVNNNGLKRNMFPDPILARSIRIIPVDFHNNIALRIEVLGCEMSVYKRV